MRSSAVIAIALVAAAGPALAAPTRPIWSKRQTMTTVDQSGAISASEIGDFVNIGNDVLDGAEKLKTLITGNSKREPQAAAPVAPAAPAVPSAPSASTSATPSTVSSITGAVPVVLTMDQSGAISASEVGDFVKIGNDVLDGAEKLKTLITGHSKREPQAPAPGVSAAPVASSAAPSASPSGASASDPMSAAIALGTIAKVASGLDTAINGFESFFGGSNSQRRDYQ